MRTDFLSKTVKAKQESGLGGYLVPNWNFIRTKKWRGSSGKTRAIEQNHRQYVA
jgi:hypothetical protein